jgi:hypothetical protein
MTVAGLPELTQRYQKLNQQLMDAGLVEKLFEQFEGYLQGHGYQSYLA